MEIVRLDMLAFLENASIHAYTFNHAQQMQNVLWKMNFLLGLWCVLAILGTLEREMNAVN